jgi:hypothetical protein
MYKLGLKNAAAVGAPATVCARAPKEFLTTHLVPATGERGGSM